MGGHVLAPAAVVLPVVVPGAPSRRHVQVRGPALPQQAGGLVGSASGAAGVLLVRGGNVSRLSAWGSMLWHGHLIKAIASMPCS